MTARLCCLLIAALLCLSVCLSTTDTEGPATEPEKPGVCPGNKLKEAVAGVCAEMCSNDSECPNDKKCCSNGCGHQCMTPYAEKPGSCPKNHGEGLCVEECSHDTNCVNDQKCCSNGCGHQCMAPYKGAWRQK
ncbi:WAP four-disulfide core domain protein 18-like isoform X2 [Onychostoma macrolepis]|uniref:WAP four-disulfide core domain protein 18-like isoform X2 n=1 Tax=Onychostoma macrolepis TaxID=369639 RepID=UPI00272B0CCE|nr:WAP four-disulfide core domain protein 18-like isoform X2 [Onychostoma macrolepis]